MTDPKRLCAPDSDRVTRLLLLAGRSESPGRPRLGKIAAVAGAGAALSSKAAASSALIAASPLASSSAISVAAVLKWLGAGVLGGLLVSGAATGVQLAADPAVDETAARYGAPFSTLAAGEGNRPILGSGAVAPEQPEPASTEPSSKAVLGAGAIPRAKPEADSPARPARAASVPHEKPAREAPSNGARAGAPESVTLDPGTERALREEVAALALAKSALNRGAAGAALDAVRAYRELYPRGRLGPEATYIEMEAALAIGDRQRAQKAAGRLATGAGPSAQRAREILEGR